MLHRHLFGGLLLAAAVGLPLAWLVSQARAAETPYQHLASALYEMREAKGELKDERFKRHREETIKDLDTAIEETEKALKESKIELKRFEAPKEPKEYYKAYKDFPHLRHAVVELREAKKEIEREKRGEFGRAVKAIDVAIVKVEEALKDEK